MQNAPYPSSQPWWGSAMTVHLSCDWCGESIDTDKRVAHYHRQCFRRFRAAIDVSREWAQQLEQIPTLTREEMTRLGLGDHGDLPRPDGNGPQTRLARLRMQSGMHSVGVAAKLGVSQSTVERWEKTTIPPGRREAVAELFGVSVSHLMMEDG
jgi:DNA-binding XRE family transcriptional regulator